MTEPKRYSGLGGTVTVHENGDHEVACFVCGAPILFRLGDRMIVKAGADGSPAGILCTVCGKAGEK